MKTRTSKRALTLVLVIVLTFVLAVSAFATWSSFQGRNTNNGTISVQPAISPAPTATAVPLEYNNPDYSVYTGVDAASVIQGNYAFTLYNGGVTSGTAGGARMQATNITTTNPDNRVYWNIQLDASASNSNQLSTPYYDSSTNTIYAAVTYETSLDSFTSLSDWSASGGAVITSGIATFDGANQSVSKSISLAADVHTIYLPTNLTIGTESATVNYTVTLSNGTDTYILANNSSTHIPGENAYWPGTYDTYNGAKISAGNYMLTFTVNSISAGSATLSTVNLSRYDWRLYSISSVLTQSPVKSSVLASGEGQINTHINGIGNYLFFGGWGGDHSYYQYGPINGTASLSVFTPREDPDFDDFYYAGASKVSENDNSSVVFGSESGTIYVRPVGDDFDDNDEGSEINLALTQSACGPIRSSICVKSSTWYLTTRGQIIPGTTTYGYLWKITNGTSNNPTLISRVLPGNTTSTPVVGNNNVLYIGYFSGNTGGVLSFPTSFTSSTNPTAIYSGDPVQSSPIVYSVSRTGDYVYFSTNSYTGAGYCYFRSTGTSPTIQAIWSAGGTSGNAYAVQGFASENGYLIYGDDGNYLYIIH